MKKVLFSVNHITHVYNFRVEIIEKLLSSGYAVTIMLPYDKRIEDLKELGCEYVQLDFDRHGTKLLSEIMLIIKYYKLFRKIKPDVILSYTIKPNIYGGIVCRFLKIPYIPNVTGLGTATENESSLQKFLLFLYRYAFGKAKTIFIQNAENMAFLEKHKIAIGHYELLPGSGVNLIQFSPIPYPSTETVQFVFLGRIMKEKGIDQYLDAAKFIRNKYKNTVFHICGFYEQAYEETINTLNDAGIVKYHGMVSDVREILKEVHCLVHPTYYPEGMSNVLLEASACARPVIATNRAGCREIIDDGINGFFVKEKDSANLIEVIERFIVLPYEKKIEMGLNGRTKAEREFDRQVVVDKYIEVIENEWIH